MKGTWWLFSEIYPFHIVSGVIVLTFAEKNGDGKIFAWQNAVCECYAQLTPELFTQKYFRLPGEDRLYVTGGHKSAAFIRGIESGLMRRNNCKNSYFESHERSNDGSIYAVYFQWRAENATD
jgi:hypothetical protein